MSAIVVYGCQELLHALSRDILNGFHFSRDLELTRKQLDFFSTFLYPFLILFIQYVVFSTRWLRILTESNSSSNSNHWFPVPSFPVQGILSISAMDLESKYCCLSLLGLRPMLKGQNVWPPVPGGRGGVRGIIIVDHRYHYICYCIR